jgi:Ca2+-binding EF-hand superfamily protein
LYPEVNEVKQSERKDPFAILKDYITSKGYRLIDFFKQFDKDGSGAIDRKEFIAGVKVCSFEIGLKLFILERMIINICD